MNLSIRSSRVTLLCLAQLALASQAFSAELTLPRSGWSSWQVPAVAGAPAWCCWTNWKEASPSSCHLDRDNDGYGNRNDEKTDAVRMYARVANGKIDRLRVLSASCRVESATPIQELGPVAPDDSARWLINLTRQNNTEAVGENALAALAMHRGDVAGDALAAMARSDTRVETRKRSIFWLALLRGSEGADIASSIMFDDKDAKVREHAAFAVAQSKSPKAPAQLIRLGNSDREGHVRAQAWFWLAQTGASDAETAIVAALKNDKDEHVREQAIFALSQLPEDRATRALIAAAQDQSLSREQRKRAIFWLAQSKSDAAHAHLDKILNASD